MRFCVSKEKTFERAAIPPNKLHFTDSTFHAVSAGLFRINFCQVVVEISIGVFFAVGTKKIRLRSALKKQSELYKFDKYLY